MRSFNFTTYDAGRLWKLKELCCFKNVLALKDLRLAIEHGESEGIELTSGKSVVNVYEKAMDTKYKDLDWTAMFNFVKESNNLD